MTTPAPIQLLSYPDMAQPLAIQAVMFDLDGTLVNAIDDIEAALNAMLNDLDLPAVNQPCVGHTIGRGTDRLVHETLQHVGALPADAPIAPSAPLFQRALSGYQQHYARTNGQRSYVYPGVREGLDTLRQAGLPLACVTNKPVKPAHSLLMQLGLLPYFVCVHGGDSFARRKPDPLPLVETAKLLGSPLAHTLMIGDSSNDAQAAQAAGCPVLLLGYGHNHGQPVQSVAANGYLQSLADLRVQASI